MIRALTTISAFACLAMSPTATAQCFETNIGTPLSMANDSIAANNQLGFSFTWPDGTTSTAIDIDDNGRILPSGVGAYSLSYPDVYEILNSPTALYVFWAPIDPVSSGNSGVHFRTNGVDAAWVTWNDVIIDPYAYGYSAFYSFTVQAELRSDGSFRFSYDQNTAYANYYYQPGYGSYYFGLPIVGASAGNGVADPGSSDLSNALFGTIDTGTDPIIYEAFSYYYSYGFDLANDGLDFTPNGSGGYTVTRANCTTGTGTLALTSRTCVPRAPTLRWTPDGSGGYGVASGTSDFSSSFGSSLSTTSSVSTVALGFSFPMPGGRVVSSIDIDPNGRILEGGQGLADPTPSVAELLSSASGIIAPFWTALVGDRFSQIFFSTDNAGTARITWWQFMQPGAYRRLTFQLELRASGAWEVVFEDTDNFTAANLCIGCSVGGGAADPGESNFSAVPIATAGNATSYEFFASSENYDLSGGPLFELLPSSNPTLGTIFNSRLETIPPTATLAAVMIGFSNPNLDLGLVFTNLDCRLAVNPTITVNMASRGWTPGMSTATLGLDLSGLPGLTGLQVHMQGIIVDTTLPWASTLPIGLTNGLRVTL